jgi:hypothetical protein
MSPLLDALISLLADWRQVFRQQRSFSRALRLSLAQILTPGQRLLSRLIAASGRQDLDWTGDYKLFSRSPWQTEHLFRPVIKHCLEYRLCAALRGLSWGFHPSNQDRTTHPECALYARSDVAALSR